MNEEENVEFGSLSVEERIEVVDKRTGNQPGRLSDPKELLNLEGETIYLVTSPFGKDKNIGNCFILTWEVGPVYDHRGNLVKKDRELTFDNDEKYMCAGCSDPNIFLSLKDFNIIPNTYNNHCAFKTKEEADAYAMYRKMCFTEDPQIAELDGDYHHWFSKEDVERLIKAEQQASSSES